MVFCPNEFFKLLFFLVHCIPCYLAISHWLWLLARPLNIGAFVYEVMYMGQKPNCVSLDLWKQRHRVRKNWSTINYFTCEFRRGAYISTSIEWHHNRKCVQSIVFYFNFIKITWLQMSYWYQKVLRPKLYWMNDCIYDTKFIVIRITTETRSTFCPQTNILSLYWNLFHLWSFFKKFSYHCKVV